MTLHEPGRHEDPLSIAKRPCSRFPLGRRYGEQLDPPLLQGPAQNLSLEERHVLALETVSIKDEDVKGQYSMIMLRIEYIYIYMG